MMNINKLLPVIFILFTVLVSSCKKDEITDPADLTKLLLDEAQANDFFDDIANETDDISGLQTSNLKTGNDSVTYNGRSVVYSFNFDGTRNIEVTYNNFQHPVAKNARVKNGKINIVITGTRLENTYKRVLTFSNFSINGNKIEGTKSIEKQEHLKYKISLNGGKVTFTDSTYITLSGTRTRTMVKGEQTPLYIWDDAYTFEGHSAGTNSKGIEFTKEITKAIKILTAYRYPVEGMFKFTTGANELLLDYGNGTPDAKATLTINGVVKEINLR
jgi:hypothetical protein